ncbi:hypothetical protein TEA_019744 [Camellia sinensis var. sinensis]|uniref:POX domain-containing protein n=1 Tax=Camellia sinensis var. sinensis TaxID=542762 RepID=A0A4S4ES29_CAMSN|nr:hypothetical protein TEA_019744 [Camellia sinensis var. sinensis]
MSQQDYHHQSIFNFSNGFERAQQEQQIRRDKLRAQGFEPPPPLVAIEDEVSGGIPVYETAGMLSEMFNFQAGATTAATQLLENQISQNYGNTRPPPSPLPPPPPSVEARVSGEWYRQGMVVGGGLGPMSDSKNQNIVNNHHHHHQISSMNADSAAAMQLFLMNPQQQQQLPRSPPSPSQSHHHHPHETSSTLHMLLPNPNPSAFHNNQIGLSSSSSSQFTWVPDGGHERGTGGGVVEGQGLSLSLSSSLQHLEAAKAEELRMGEGGIMFFNQGGGASSDYQYKNLGGGSDHHQVHVGFGSSPLGVVNGLRNSKYVKAAQELLEEFCCVGRAHFKKNKFGRQNTNNPNPNPTSSAAAAGGGSSSSKDLGPLSAADRIDHQRRKVDRRYNRYCEQMQMVVNSFDLVMGYGAAMPYTALAQKAMSRHFRCLKDAIAAQLKHSCELLGDKDAGTSGVTKGETPRLRLLEQSLRQQREFHQMRMIDQEAWRPQRGLPDRSVNILRAWLFEHFLHPSTFKWAMAPHCRFYGLRVQVSNWFINARVRLWKPMVEDMYQQETKEEEESGEEEGQINHSSITGGLAQTPTPPPISTTTTTTTSTSTLSPSVKRSQINALDSDTSLLAINTQCFSENQAKQPNFNTTISATTTAIAPLVVQSFTTSHEADTCRRGSMVGSHYRTNTAIATATTLTGNGDMGSTQIRFGPTGGDVSLTLGLRHAGNVPEKSPFSVRDFGAC